ncbi:MAG TPA: hypothetical protein VGG25_16595 [Streptosporangiaceae bacterium]
MPGSGQAGQDARGAGLSRRGQDRVQVHVKRPAQPPARAVTRTGGLGQQHPPGGNRLVTGHQDQVAQLSLAIEPIGLASLRIAVVRGFGVQRGFGGTPGAGCDRTVCLPPLLTRRLRRLLRGLFLCGLLNVGGLPGLLTRELRLLPRGPFLAGGLRLVIWHRCHLLPCGRLSLWAHSIGRV